MTTEEKQLLLKDLCARLPYEVQCEIGGLRYGPYTFTGNYVEDLIAGRMFKPYLRPMSSMTEEERKEYNKTKAKIAVQWDGYGTPIGYEYTYTIKTFDWLLEHHFDYRNLINKGLALEAPGDMYKEK